MCVYSVLLFSQRYIRGLLLTFRSLDISKVPYCHSSHVSAVCVCVCIVVFFCFFSGIFGWLLLIRKWRRTRHGFRQQSWRFAPASQWQELKCRKRFVCCKIPLRNDTKYETIYKATNECKNYIKRIGSLEAIRSLFHFIYDFSPLSAFQGVLKTLIL